MKLRTISSAVIAAAAISFAGAASAVPIDVEFNVAALGAFTTDTGDITTANTVTTGAANLVGSIVNNNIGVLAGQSVMLAPNPLGLTLGSVFTKEFTTPLGTFLETLTVTFRDPGPSSLGIQAQGTITGGGFDPTPVFWSAAYTQNAGPTGGQINGSFNNSTTPPRNRVPEPASLALVGLAIAAMGLTRRRRS